MATAPQKLEGLDVRSATVTALRPLGTKDHSVVGQGLDPSDEDDEIAIAPSPVSGLFLPDSIASYRVRGRTYLVTANEGDGRDYDGFSEEARVKELVLDPTVFPAAADLQQDEKLGRLNVTTTLGDVDGDGDYDALYSFGARSFSIWSAEDGALVYDSGEDLEIRKN